MFDSPFPFVSICLASVPLLVGQSSLLRLEKVEHEIIRQTVLDTQKISLAHDAV